MKKQLMITLTAVLGLAVSACGQDVTASDEYRALEAERADLRQQLSATQAELADVQEVLEEAAPAALATGDEPASSARHDRALAVLTEIKEILDDPESYGTEDEIADLLGSHATESAMMDDDVFGAVNYRQAFYNTLFGGSADARITVHDLWVSDDGTQGGVLWVWSGTNFAGNPFELPGISLTKFAEDGRISYELVTYPYADDFVREAFMGSGTPTPSTGAPE